MLNNLGLRLGLGEDQGWGVHKCPVLLFLPKF